MVLDSLAKDGMIILGFRLMINWTLVTPMIKIVPEYNYYVAISIVNLNVFLGMSLVVQCSTFSVIRYLLVFHFDFINSRSEKTIQLISRTCVVVLASLCLMIDDYSKNREFLYLTQSQFTEKDAPKKVYLNVMSSIIITCVSILIMIVVQGRIVHERMKMPELFKKYKWDFFNLKTVSFALFVVSVIFLLRISIAFVNVYVITSLSSTMRSCIITFMVILILIKSNNRMYVYVKRKIIPEFILRDIEMYRHIYSNPTTESHQTLPMNFRTSDFPNTQSNNIQPLNPFVISKSIDQARGRNLPIQINVNLTSNIQPSRNALPDVSM